MNNREEKISALLLDNRFVDWVVNPQSPYAEYWLQWIISSTENATLAEEAKIFLWELRRAGNDTAKEINEGITEQMLINIREAIDKDSLPVFMQKPAAHRWYWMAAAAMVGALVFFGVTFFKQSKSNRQFSVVEPAKEKQPSNEISHYNGSEKNELVFLPDGSKVTLAKGARISYNRLMSGKKRRVSLNGEAFFDVAKNPEKPFLICTQSMIIKVLGTSFRVTAITGKESVTVKTGKVSVYLKGQDKVQSAEKIIFPWQVCTYSATKKELVTATYIGKSKIEIEVENKRDYNFEDAPLEKVLGMLEKMYGLALHYDKDTFKNCFITISLENESLEDKLEIITKTVGASFSISDYGISIEGKGCK
ncbi:MAG TPA: FecR family protein [Chitinophagaceae bacterium]|nr:FecR family protein [Chitinophagaceae bacterium]